MQTRYLKKWPRVTLMELLAGLKNYKLFSFCIVCYSIGYSSYTSRNMLSFDLVFLLNAKVSSLRAGSYNLFMIMGRFTRKIYNLCEMYTKSYIKPFITMFFFCKRGLHLVCRPGRSIRESGKYQIQDSRRERNECKRSSYKSNKKCI